jgi:hypothetical protein
MEVLEKDLPETLVCVKLDRRSRAMDGASTVLKASPGFRERAIV